MVIRHVCQWVTQMIRDNVQAQDQNSTAQTHLLLNMWLHSFTVQANYHFVNWQSLGFPIIGDALLLFSDPFSHLAVHVVVSVALGFEAQDLIGRTYQNRWTADSSQWSKRLIMAEPTSGSGWSTVPGYRPGCSWLCSARSPQTPKTGPFLHWASGHTH